MSLILLFSIFLILFSLIILPIINLLKSNLIPKIEIHMFYQKISFVFVLYKFMSIHSYWLLNILFRLNIVNISNFDSITKRFEISILFRRWICFMNFNKLIPSISSNMFIHHIIFQTFYFNLNEWICIIRRRTNHKILDFPQKA